MTRTSFAHRSLLLILFALAAAPLAALPSPMVHPNLARGDDGTFHRFAYDAVNVFNGNLRVDIPIGQSYPVSSGFSYRLVLRYNSNAWDFTQNTDGTVRAEPMALSNAGMGWDLSLGRLVPPGAPGNTLQRWIYVAPDGTASPFYDRLHPAEVSTTTGVVRDVFYSRDGTYRRLRRTDVNNARVEMPDGRVSVFAFDAATNAWRLTFLSDKFGSWVGVTYGTGMWTLTDGHGRAHRVYFVADPAGVYGGLVDRVEVAAFAGMKATYSFTYGTKVAARPSDTDPASPTSLTVPVLQAVGLPDGTSYSFTYPDANGRLGSMVLPILGQIEWDWGDYLFARGSGCTGAGLQPVARKNRGVATRRARAADATLEGTWTLTRSGDGSFGASCTPGIKLGVRSPHGDVHNYYHTVTTGRETGGDPGNYGLPSHPTVIDGLGRGLSERVFDCDTAGANCIPMRSWYRRYEQSSGATPGADDATQVNRREAAQRTVYHDDGQRWAAIDRSDFDGLGHYRRHVTGGNFGKADYLERFIDFDAASNNQVSPGWGMPSPSQPWVLGTFRETRVSDGATTEAVDYCFDRATGRQTRMRLRYSASAPTAKDVVTSFTADASGNVTDEHFYGGDVQALGTAADLCALSLPSTDQYRIQHAYQHGALASSRHLTSTGATFGPPFVDRTIDRNTGLTAQERNSAGVRTDVTYDSMGRVIWVKPETGHGAWVRHQHVTATGSSWWARAAVQTLEYPNGQVWPNYLTRRFTYYDDFGRVEGHRVWMPEGLESHTTFEYDALGRLRRESEPHYPGDPVKWRDYLDHDPFGRARVERPPSGAADEVTYEYLGERVVRRTGQVGVYHDSSGNVVREGQTSERIFDRQGRLWKTVIYGSPTSGSPDHVTEYFYDLAGRPTKTLQDGVRRGDELVYDGRGFVSRRHSGPDVYVMQTLDAFGGATEYYRQRGSFLYFLHQTYDRAGRLTEIRSPNYAPYLLVEYVYALTNGAGDLRAGKLWQARRYHDFDAAATWADGGQYPYWQVHQAWVTETYTYGGPGGRMSALNVTMQSSKDFETTTTTFAYDELGNVVEIGYPAGNVDDQIGLQLHRNRTVRHVHEYGRVTAVDGQYARGSAAAVPEVWAAVGYHGNGMVEEVAHGNGVSYLTTLDPVGGYRYGSVRTTGALTPPGPGSGWQPLDLDLQGIQYDGEGNVVRIGEEFLVPDNPPVYQTQPSPPPPPSHVGCFGEDTLVGFIDPLGARIVYPDFNGCNPQAFAMYTASGALYKLDDFRGNKNNHRWIFADPEGTVLTEITTYRGDEPRLRDFIYLGDRLLATHDRLWLLEDEQTWHYHPGVAGKSAVTDTGRHRVDLDPESW